MRYSPKVMKPTSPRHALSSHDYAGAEVLGKKSRDGPELVLEGLAPGSVRIRVQSTAGRPWCLRRESGHRRSSSANASAKTCFRLWQPERSAAGPWRGARTTCDSSLPSRSASSIRTAPSRLHGGGEGYNLRSNLHLTLFVKGLIYGELSRRGG